MNKFACQSLASLLLLFAIMPSIAATHPLKSSVHSVSVAKNPQAVNINSADAATLATLKGIGTRKAQAIVHYRHANGPFKSLQDLTNVQGIGDKFLARLQKNNPQRIQVK